MTNQYQSYTQVIRALDYQRKKFPRRTRIGQVLRYFRRNRHRMRYADTQARHLPIGSGVVEAACKTLVTQRLKRSGMRWRRAGARRALAIGANSYRSIESILTHRLDERPGEQIELSAPIEHTNIRGANYYN